MGACKDQYHVLEFQLL